MKIEVYRVAVVKFGIGPFSFVDAYPSCGSTPVGTASGGFEILAPWQSLIVSGLYCSRRETVLSVGVCTIVEVVGGILGQSGQSYGVNHMQQGV